MRNKPRKPAGTRRRHERVRERGSILATSAIGMLSILLAVGLGVDISRLYLTKAELQNAADAAALAGVSGLNGASPGITEATNRAVAAMNKYNLNKTNVSFPRANVQFAVNLDGPYMSEGAAGSSALNIRFVKVTTPAEPVGISFAAIVLGNTKNLTATATAGQSVTVNMLCPWLPAFVYDPENKITKGGVYTFRLGPGDHLSPGDYQLLAPITSGGSGDREGMANGVNWCVKIGERVKTKPGVTSGAIRQGIDTRFDKYVAGMDPAISPPDKNISEPLTHDQYVNNSPFKPPSHKGVADRRVVFIPIATEAPGAGRDWVEISKFGVFFLQTSVGGGSGGELKAEYITTTQFAGNSYFAPGAGPGMDGLAVPVLYK